MTTISPDNIVEDWGGFEKLVAKLHETGSVTVQHNVKVKGQSGAVRQIDVLIRHTQGLYEHLILVECKHWNSSVKRIQVDAMATAIRDLNASKGVIFTTKDFQSGAVTAAESFGVDLVKVREFADSEWGRPGRHIDFFIQYFQRSIGNLKVDASTLALPGLPPKSPHLDLHIVGEEGETGTTSTPTTKADGTSGETLEKIIVEKSAEALNQLVQSNNFILGEDDAIERWMKTPVNIEAPNTIVAQISGTPVFISRISFDLAVKITQHRFQYDRKARYQFALAIENKLTGKVTAATRLKDAEKTHLATIEPEKVEDREAVLKNGSVMKVTLKGFFPFEEALSAMQSLTPKIVPGVESP
ncbi:MAG: hypothetical protein JWN74_500 [Acidobacteriaceae bacterium]|nr:hypothetical protein [Acidobacteriaceae bacterium]